MLHPCHEWIPSACCAFHSVVASLVSFCSHFQRFMNCLDVALHDDTKLKKASTLLLLHEPKFLTNPWNSIRHTILICTHAHLREKNFNSQFLLSSLSSLNLNVRLKQRMKLVLLLWVRNNSHSERRRRI
jgi:hypothetical protein